VTVVGTPPKAGFLNSRNMKSMKGTKDMKEDRRL
jgi:hypothetical protein